MMLHIRAFLLAIALTVGTIPGERLIFAQVSGPDPGVSTTCGVEGVGPDGNCLNGVSSGQVSTNPPSGSVVSPCTGTIDLSTGCIQPELGLP